MKSHYLIELPNGASLRLRGGVRRSLERYDIDPAHLRIGPLQQICYWFATLVGPLKNRLTKQVWRIAIEITAGDRQFHLDVTHDSQGFVADCFVRVFGPDRFGLLYESLNPDTGKGEIHYRLYVVDDKGVHVCLENTLLADPQRHYSYPAFFEVDEKGFGFSVESIDMGRMEIFRAEFNGRLHTPAELAGEYIDPNIVALPNGKEWLLFYSKKTRPDELVIQPLRRTAVGFEKLGQPITLLNTWLARGGGDVFIAPCENGGLTISRYSQLSLPVYGSHLSCAEIKLSRVEKGWHATVQTVNRKFGASYRLKKRGKGIHTFSHDSAFGISVKAFDWR